MRRPISWTDTVRRWRQLPPLTSFEQVISWVYAAEPRAPRRWWRWWGR